MKRIIFILVMSMLVSVMFAQSNDYLCFTAVNGAATVKLTAVGNDIPSVSLKYSTNKTTWSTYTIDQVISLASGGKVYFKATSSNARLATYNSTTYTYSYHKFVMTGQVAASGKITSLISSTTTSRVVNTYAFARLFENCTSLISAPELPATSLSAECYKWMFSGCTGLTAAPALPAAVMASTCYCGMFMDCTGLVAAPDLPATVLADYCYAGMFLDCTGLTTAPSSLPATQMKIRCCEQMFSGCTSLTVAPELPATTLADLCYMFMFYGCTSLTTPPSSLPATTMAEEACWAMFSGCTSLQTTPQLPATTLADGCYQWMFADCTSLTSVPTLSSTTLYPSCYRGMFSGCSNIRLNLAAPGTLWKIPAAAASSASSATNWGTDMFKNTGGTMTGQPTPGQNYYIGNSSPAPTTAVITVNTTGNGTVTGAGTYNVGDTVTLTATPASGYTFAGWSNGSTSATISFVVTGDETLTANFQQQLDYLCFTAVNGPATVKLTVVGSNAPSVSLQYSTNGTSWNAYSINQVISLASGGMVYFRATNTNYRMGWDVVNYNQFVMTGTVAASGKVSSLNDNTMSTLTMATFGYESLFKGCSSLISAPELPATTMAYYCYHDMFNGCTGLTSAPALPATNLNKHCYAYMFMNCTGLTTPPPSLPATTMQEFCYYGMFWGCTNLTSAPALPSTSLDKYCYHQMFKGCSRLSAAPALPATVLFQGCYDEMFEGCTRLTSAPALPATTLADNCYSNMFRGCTRLTAAPALPALTMADYCYSLMFENCSALISVPALPSTNLAEGCYVRMFSGCTSLTTPPALPATTLANTCYDLMFSGCRSLTTTPALPATTMTSMCYCWMFQNCTSLTTVPDLPATTLADNCYKEMFKGCTNIRLNLTGSGKVWKIPAAAATSAASATNWGTNMFTGTGGSLTGQPTVGQNYYDQNAQPTQIPDYLCFTAVNGAATVRLCKNGTPSSISLQYSTNGTTWQSYSVNQTISLTSGGKVYFKATTSNNTFSTYNTNYYYFVMTGTIAASGKVTSLLDQTMTRTNVGQYAFFYLFKNCSSLISAPELPATTLADRCYEYMFYNCTGLTSAPALPAMTLGARCYADMFNGCTALTSVPALPATTMYGHCYSNMFKNCIGLITPPVISATTMADYCFAWMFDGCSNLATAPALPATNLAADCYYSMFGDCTSLTAAPALPATNLPFGCYEFMFDGCTSLTTVSDFPVSTLNTQCYYAMFRNCSSLVNPPALPTLTLAQSCYTQMFKGCTALISPPDLPATTLAFQCYMSMFENCSSIKLNLTGAGKIWKIPAAAATSAASATNWGTNMFTGTSGTLQGQPVPGQDYYDQNAQPTQIPDYLCFTAVNGPATIKLTGVLTAPPSISLEYSTNGTSWLSYTINQTISMASGSKVYFRATSTNYSLAYLNAYSSSQGYHRFVMTGTIAASGNVMSLLDKTMTTTSLNKWAFAYLFSQCTSLISPPELPATTLANSCYLYMFHSCSNLTSAPTLPALAMDSSCYDNMFAYCTSLTTPPALPATTMAYACYNYMFRGCTALNSVPVLPATTMADRSYFSMFVDCTSLTAGPALPATTLGSYCYCRMFEGCTGLTTVPDLPATRLASYCYASMFEDCSNIKLYPTGSGTIWKIPSGATAASYWGRDMFTGTGGTLTGQPVIGQNYYYNQTPSTGTVTVVANPAIGGSVTGGGTYNVGSTATLTATPASGYTFSGWSNGSTSSTITINVAGDTTLTANFEPMLDYLCFTAVNGAATIKLTAVGSAPSVSLQYSTNGTSWSSYTINQTISLSSGGKVYFRATNTNARMGSSLFVANTFVMTGSVAASGDVMSLLDKSLNTKSLNTFAFHRLFYGCSSLVSAPVMSATTMGQYSCCRMYENCAGLVTASPLPATTLATNCYDCMFQGCGNLASAPALPATTLAVGCYNSMFENCSALTRAVDLPATTLPSGCYTDMFRGCSKIKLYPTGSGVIWKIPSGASGTGWGTDMFTGTGGTLQGQPVIGQDYYYDQTVPKGTVTVVANPASGGSVTGGGTYNVGSTATLTATPTSGYTFAGWSNGSTSSTITINVAGDTTITANFEPMLDYLCFTAVGGPATIKLAKIGNPATVNLQYSVNGSSWSSYTINQTISLSSGDKVYFRATTSNYTLSSSMIDYYHFDMTGHIAASGNITSLLDKTLTRTNILQYSYITLFNSDTSLLSAPDLPATTLAYSCYKYMFSGCTGLTTAPALPSTNLANDCYMSMFENCTGLTETPYLPATTMVQNCYYCMFSNCSSLTVTHTLPATVLAKSCYHSMFRGCTSLVNAPVIMATTLASNCCEWMFYGCINLTGAPVLPATSLSIYCYLNMFEGCTSLTVAPALPATVMQQACYQGMFMNCTSLTIAPVLQSTSLHVNCYYNMFRGCTNLTTVPALPATALPSGCYDRMFYGCSNIKLYPVGSGVIWKIPSGASGTGWGTDMFTGTGGTLQGQPVIGQDYYYDPTVPKGTVTVVANPANGGSVTGGGMYNVGSTATLTATPATGYHFTGWSNGSTATTISFTVTGDTTFVASFAKDIYTVTGAANPASGGSVTGGGSYTHGSTVTLTATPATGYHFTGWSNGQTTSSISFTATGNTTITANFAKNVYTVTVAANPASGGTVTGGGTYTHGSTVTLTATPATGYHFTGWSNGQTTSSISFTATGNTTITANFAQNVYTVAGAANPASGGVVIGGGSYVHGSNVTLTAVAVNGYRFTSWSNGSTATTISFTVTSDTTLTANFASLGYNVTVITNPASGGTVVGGGTYNAGSVATLTATPSAGYHFTGWSNGQTAATISFTVTGDTILVASFAKNIYTVTGTSNPANGGVVAGGGSYAHGSTVTMTATPIPGYNFTGWSNGSTATTISFTVTSDTMLMANFAPVAHNVTVMANPASGGTVTGGGVYGYGTTATVSATPAAGYSFAGWSNGVTTNTINLQVTGDTVLVANFTQNTYSVAATANPTNGGVVAGSGSYLYGSTATLTAIPAMGYRFTGWSNGATSAALSITVVGDTSVVAYFASDIFTVTAIADPVSAGGVSGGGTYNYGDTAVISVTAVDGYYFTGWSNGATSTTISVVVTSDSTLTAMFGRCEHILTVMVNDTSYGRVKVSGSYYHGDIVELTSISDAHCRLAYWSTGDTSAVIHVTLVSDTTIEAYFEWDEYIVTAVSNDSACGFVRGSGAFRYDDVAELTAVAEDGCKFVSWSNGATTSNIKITVVSDTVLTAYFETNQDVAVDEAEANEYIVYSERWNVVVHGAEGRRIAIYDVVGRLVEMVADGMEDQSFEVYAAGVYLIKVDDLPATRILVR